MRVGRSRSWVRKASVRVESARRSRSAAFAATPTPRLPNGAPIGSTHHCCAIDRRGSRRVHPAGRRDGAGANPGDISASTSITGVNTFKTDLDSGGDFHWATGIVSGTITRQLTPQFAAGISLRYDYEDWKFGSPVVFGGQAPWKNLNAPNIAVNLSYAVAPDLTIGVTPTVGWSYESGASTGDAVIYGAIVSATKVFSPTVVLGIGAGIVRQIDETKVFPFLIVHWQIDDKWLLSNPFRAGPPVARDSSFPMRSTTTGSSPAAARTVRTAFA